MQKKKVVKNFVILLELKKLGCEVTSIFCLNASFPRRLVSKAKHLMAHTVKMKDSWLCRCLNTRENMLAYFAALDKISFEMPLFPLPPAFEFSRKKALETLDARNIEILKTLKSTNSTITEDARQLSTFNLSIEELGTRIREVLEDLLKKKCPQRSKSEFRSGERVSEAKSLASIYVSLHSPCEKNNVISVVHNCRVQPKVDGPNAEINIFPDYSSTTDAKKWNWFAILWLEFDGNSFFKEEIALLEESKMKLQAELDDMQNNASLLQFKMLETSTESTKICTSIAEIHRLRKFLKRVQYPLEDIQKLLAAQPLDDLTKLATSI